MNDSATPGKSVPEVTPETRRRNIRTAVLLGIIVVLFYGSFFLVMSK